MLNYEQVFKKYNVTKRQMDVISFVFRGKCNQEIADLLNISVSTVKFHLTSIYKITRLQSRLELATKMRDFQIPRLPNESVVL